MTVDVRMEEAHGRNADPVLTLGAQLEAAVSQLTGHTGDGTVAPQSQACERDLYAVVRRLADAILSADAVTIAGAAMQARVLGEFADYVEQAQPGKGQLFGAAIRSLSATLETLAGTIAHAPATDAYFLPPY